MNLTFFTHSLQFDKDEIKGSIPDRFARVAAAYPQRVAAKSPGQSLTYRNLDRSAHCLAHELLSRLGGGAEAVALLLDNDAGIIGAILGVVFSGKFYCALNPRDPPRQLTGILVDLPARLLVTNTHYQTLALQIAPPDCSILNIDELNAKSPQEPLHLNLPSDALAGIFYTSGSTGASKGVPRDHGTILHRTWLDINDFRIRFADRLLLLRSCSFSGSLADIFDALLTGASVYIESVEERGLSSLTDVLGQEEITIFRPPIELLRYLINSWGKGTFFPKVRRLILTGDILYKNDIERARPFFPKNLVIVHHLSSSETGLLARLLIHHDTEIKENIVPVGYPVPDKEIVILDDKGHKLAAGQVGEIAVRTRFGFIQYWGKPGLTAKKFIPDPDHKSQRIFLSGDLGRLTPDGQLEFLGRKDFQVKIRGFRVDLAVIENLLMAISAVRRAVVVVRKDAAGKDRLVAYLTARQGASLSPDLLRAKLAATLPRYMLPSIFTMLDEFPLASNGKVNRRALPEPDWHNPAKRTKYAAPQNAMEQRLLEIWQKILGIPQLGVEDDFLSLGGDSLLAAQMMTEVELLFKRRLPLALLAEYRTIRSLVHFLENGDVRTASPLIAFQSSGSRLPLFLFPGREGDVFYFRDLVRQIGKEQPIYGVELADLGTDTKPSTRLDETAATYLHEIRRTQISGPYYLAGHSFGGRLAFEMARQLVASGQSVAFLGLLDTYAPGSDLRASAIERIRIHLENLSKLTTHERYRYFIERFKNIALKLLRNRVLRSMAARFGIVPTDIPSINRIAASTYKPARFPGKVTLFRVIDRPNYVHSDPTAGWQAYAAEVEVHDVPGDHATLLDDPNVGALAEELRKCLREAQEGHSPDRKN